MFSRFSSLSSQFSFTVEMAGQLGLIKCYVELKMAESHIR